MELEFSRRSTAEKLAVIKKKDSASFGLTHRAFKRTTGEGNFIANQQNKSGKSSGFIFFVDNEKVLCDHI
jgi:hypothetical protein